MDSITTIVIIIVIVIVIIIVFIIVIGDLKISDSGAIWYKSVAGAIQKIRIRDGTIVKYRGESAVSEGWWWWQNNENDDVYTELNCLKKMNFISVDFSPLAGHMDNASLGG